MCARCEVSGAVVVFTVPTIVVSRRGRSQSYDPTPVARSFRIEQTFAAATEPGEDLQTSLDARAPGFGAESVSAELSGDEWTVVATFQDVDTREEAEARLGALLEASGFPPSATSSGATEISELDE
jgi:hypothetical protein